MEVTTLGKANFQDSYHKVSDGQPLQHSGDPDTAEIQDFAWNVRVRYVAVQW